VEAEDIYALMEALRARRGYISAEDLRALIERRGGPIIPELQGHTVVEMKRLPKGTNTTGDGRPYTNNRAISQLQVDPAGHPAWVNKESGKTVVRHDKCVHASPNPDGWSGLNVELIDFLPNPDGSWTPRWSRGPMRTIHGERLEIYHGGRQQPERDGLIDFYPQPDGRIVRVYKMPKDSGIGYRIMLDADVLHDSHPAASECRNIVQAPDGTWYALHGTYVRNGFIARPLVEDSDRVTDIAAVDLALHSGTLYLIADHTKVPDNTTQPEFRAAVHKRLGTGVTVISLTKIPYKRWFTPDVAQGGYEEEPTYLGETYVGQVGDGNARFETWIAQNFYPDTPPLLVGPNWDHVSQTFQDPEYGLCYWAVAGMHLYKVAFSPYG